MLGALLAQVNVNVESGRDTPILIAGLVCVVVTTSVRLAAVRFGWTFPEQRPLRPRRPKGPSASTGSR